MKYHLSNMFFEDARDVLSLLYKFDKSSTFSNDFYLHGNQLRGEIIKNESFSKESLKPKFDVNIYSEILTLDTIKELVSNYDFAIKEEK